MCASISLNSIRELRNLSSFYFYNLIVVRKCLFLIFIVVFFLSVPKLYWQENPNLEGAKNKDSTWRQEFR